jgi:hypothetical protein
LSEKISAEADGKTYTGHYEVKRRLITVATANGQKTTQLGGTPAAVLARQLLLELIREGKG